MKISKTKIGQKMPPFSEEHKRKISESHRGEKNPFWGKHLNKKHKSKISLATKGSNNHNWKGGISEQGYPFNFNEELKELVRKRDGYRCQLCGCPEIENMRKLDVHHIDYIKENLDPRNLISLCRRDNTKVNHNRESWIEIFQNRSRKEKKCRKKNLKYSGL